MVATREIKNEPKFLLPPDADLVIQSGPLTTENEILVRAFIKKSKANRRRRQRYAEKKALSFKKQTPSVWAASVL